MQCTVARLVHRVPAHLREVGTASVGMAPDMLKRAHPNSRKSTAKEAVWSLIDPEMRLRQAMLPIPIAIASVMDDRGRMIIALALDLDGALCIASRDGAGARLTRPADGGLTDPVRIEMDHLLSDRNGLRNLGPLTGSLDAILAIHREMVPEIVHREVPFPKPGQFHADHELAHPWQDDVFAAIAEAHGADQRRVMRAAPLDGRALEWKWIGEGPLENDGTPIPGCISGLPDSMPFLTLKRINDRDNLTVGMGGVAYNRVSGVRTLRIRRGMMPETLWALITPGTPAERLCDMPGIDRYEVASIGDADPAIVTLRPKEMP